MPGIFKIHIHETVCYRSSLNHLKISHINLSYKSLSQNDLCHIILPVFTHNVTHIGILQGTKQPQKKVKKKFIKIDVTTL